ncbi:hypothetical protein GCM10027078_00330 [Nocardioides flavus (ex Wang et al. 2016)]
MLADRDLPEAAIEKSTLGSHGITCQRRHPIHVSGCRSHVRGSVYPRSGEASAPAANASAP